MWMCSAVPSHSVTLDSLQPYGLWTGHQLLCPWHSLGKSTSGVAMPNSKVSSQTRDWTQVSCIGGRFFTTELSGKPLFLHQSVQLLSHVRLFATPWTAACQVSLSIKNFWSLLKLILIVSKAIQQSYPLLSPSSPAFNLSQHQSLFKWASYLHQVARILEFQLQHQSFQWIFRTDFL